LIPNLVCEGCAEKINTILRSLPGIQEVRTKVPRKHAYVRYEPAKIQEEQIKKALEKSGFTALAA
ncbi:MAG: cation transporter, partial [Candidatus Brocadiaceae bacterium]|nr:cation transporter [Candidatus Brocadiaceae bacterium]